MSNKISIRYLMNIIDRCRRKHEEIIEDYESICDYDNSSQQEVDYNFIYQLYEVTTDYINKYICLNTIIDLNDYLLYLEKYFKHYQILNVCDLILEVMTETEEEIKLYTNIINNAQILSDNIKSFCKK